MNYKIKITDEIEVSLNEILDNKLIPEDYFFNQLKKRKFEYLSEILSKIVRFNSIIECPKNNSINLNLLSSSLEKIYNLKYKGHQNNNHNKKTRILARCLKCRKYGDDCNGENQIKIVGSYDRSSYSCNQFKPKKPKFPDKLY